MNPPINYQKVAALPALIRSFCFNNDGWVVGSAAKFLLDLKEDKPRDFDILIPFYTWGVACKSIPEGSLTNAHGGVKVTSDLVEIDVWAGDIGWFLAQAPSPAYAVHPRTMTSLSSNRQTTRSSANQT